jgi:tRNA threonylcarbamoyladenosine biosynthesis protein TsaE
MQLITYSPKETVEIGKKISRKLKPGDIVCLFGDLGSGKTMLTKGIAAGLGIDKKKVISPSFVLMRQHLSGRLPLYHFDLYRLKSCEDILAIGYEDYLFAAGVSVIEWADRLKYLLPKKFLKIELKVAGGTRRKLKFVPAGLRYKEITKELF